VLGRALDPPLEPALGRELVFGRDGAACGLGDACGLDEPAEGRLFEPGAGTARTCGREGAAEGLRDSRPLDGGVRGDALGVGARCGWRLVEGPLADGRVDGDAGRELAAGGSSGREGAAAGRSDGARAGSRDGAARVGLGSDCSGCCGWAEGGVRTGSRELGRRWSVGRERPESGASWGAARGLSCGWTRATGAGAARADARARDDDVVAAAGAAVGDSLNSARLAVGARVRTTGATASPRTRRVTSYRGSDARTGRGATTTFTPE